MDENKKARLTRIYNKYQVIDWIIAIAITVGLIVGVYHMIPTPILATLFIIGFIYVGWTVWLYIKVWPIKEIRNKEVYWFDWALTIGLTIFGGYVLFTILTGAEPFWAEWIESINYWLLNS